MPQLVLIYIFSLETEKPNHRSQGNIQTSVHGLISTCCLTADQAKEGLTSFNCYNNYYDSQYLLRLKISIDDQLVEIQEQAVIKEAFVQLGDVNLDLDKLAYEMEQVLLQYGVRRVLSAHHDEKLPLYELHFTSEHTLELFLKEKQEADRKLEEAISHLIVSNTSGPSPDLQIHTHLYFLAPQDGTQKARLQLVTAGNCKEISSKYRESFKFKYEFELFEECAGLLNIHPCFILLTRFTIIS